MSILDFFSTYLADIYSKIILTHFRLKAKADALLDLFQSVACTAGRMDCSPLCVRTGHGSEPNSNTRQSLSSSTPLIIKVTLKNHSYEQLYKTLCTIKVQKHYNTINKYKTDADKCNI